MNLYQKRMENLKTLWIKTYMTPMEIAVKYQMNKDVSWERALDISAADEISGMLCDGAGTV